MPFFENSRKRTAERAQAAYASAADANERYQDSILAVRRAEQRNGYSEARLAELSSSLGRIAVLEDNERSAKAQLKRLHTSLALIRKAHALLSARPAAYQSEADRYAQREAAAVLQVRACQERIDQIQVELEPLRLMVSKRDAELRRQFKIPDRE